MTIINQLSRVSNEQGDEVFQNYGVTTIPAGAGVLFDTVNKGDGMNPQGIVLPTPAGGVAGTCGITLEAILPGRTGKVATKFQAVAVSNATLKPGDLVSISDGAGFLGTIVAASAAKEILGKCRTDCVAGDPCVIDVMPVAHN